MHTLMKLLITILLIALFADIILIAVLQYRGEGFDFKSWHQTAEETAEDVQEPAEAPDEAAEEAEEAEEAAQPEEPQEAPEAASHAETARRSAEAPALRDEPPADG